MKIQQDPSSRPLRTETTDQVAWGGVAAGVAVPISHRPSHRRGLQG